MCVHLHCLMWQSLPLSFLLTSAAPLSLCRVVPCLSSIKHRIHVFTVKCRNVLKVWMCGCDAVDYVVWADRNPIQYIQKSQHIELWFILIMLFSIIKILILQHIEIHREYIFWTCVLCRDEWSGKQQTSLWLDWTVCLHTSLHNSVDDHSV